MWHAEQRRPRPRVPGLTENVAHSLGEDGRPGDEVVGADVLHTIDCAFVGSRTVIDDVGPPTLRGRL
jgi:hypothetical protein